MSAGGIRAGAVLAAAAVFSVACSEQPSIVVPAGPPAQLTLTTPAARAPAAPGGPVETFGDGVHQVLGEVKPGVYRTAGSWIEGVPLCSWRLRKQDHLVASGSASGPVSIVVLALYDSVESRGCQQWQRVGDAS